MRPARPLATCTSWRSEADQVVVGSPSSSSSLPALCSGICLGRLSTDETRTVVPLVIREAISTRLLHLPVCCRQISGCLSCKDSHEFLCWLWWGVSHRSVLTSFGTIWRLSFITEGVGVFGFLWAIREAEIVCSAMVACWVVLLFFPSVLTIGLRSSIQATEFL